MTEAYVINRSPSVPLYGDIPQRVWSKLDPKSRPCIFLGYGDDKFGYRLWDLVEKKATRSRNIVFREEKIIIDWEIEKLNPSQLANLILGKIENQLKNKENRLKKEPNLTQPKKSKKNRLCRMEADNIL